MLQRHLPEDLKLAIAKQIENNLFAKVHSLEIESCQRKAHISSTQVPFLSEMHDMGEICNMFSAESSVEYLQDLFTISFTYSNTKVRLCTL
jgi:hypothetical protein